jgi:hypothetical protein
VLRDGDVVHRQAIDHDGTHVLAGPIAHGAWRAEVWAGAAPRVITNHVVVD